MQSSSSYCMGLALKIYVSFFIAFLLKRYELLIIIPLLKKLLLKPLTDREAAANPTAKLISKKGRMVTEKKAWKFH